MARNPEFFRRHKQEASAPAKEVLEKLYQSLLGVKEFTLADGTKASVASYYAPEAGDDGELTCGVDVHLDNGTDLEFTVSNSGWGRRFAPGMVPTKGKQRCGR